MLDRERVIEVARFWAAIALLENGKKEKQRLRGALDDDPAKMLMPGYDLCIYSTKDLAVLATRVTQQDFNIAIEAFHQVFPPALTDAAGEKALEANKTHLAMAVAWLRLWAKYGYNVYVLGHSLFSRLVLTDPPDLPVDDFRAPFPSFRIEIPPGFVLGRDPATARKAWVRYIDVLSLAPSGTATWDPVEVREYLLTIDTQENRPGALQIHGRPLPDDVAGTYYQNTFYQAGQKMWGGRVERRRWRELPKEGNAALDTMRRVVINMCLLLQSKALVPKRTTQSKVAVKRHVARPTRFTFKVTKIATHLIDGAKAVAQGEKKARKEWKVKIKFIVRGHYRNQACGPGMKQHKLIWIEPYWKGPEGEDGWAKITEVE